MSDIPARLSEDLKAAMKARDTTALNALRALKTALTNAAVEKGGTGSLLDEAEVVQVVRRQVKQRHDSIEQYQRAGRAELAATEQAEIEVLERYLPAPLEGAELDRLVDQAVAECGATSRADIGRVMKLLQQRTEGRADGRTLSAAVMARLA